MDLSASVSITEKGLAEVKTRAHKLGMKKRSILISLEKPHTIEYLISRSVFPGAELAQEIQALAGEGFVCLSREVDAPRVDVSNVTPATHAIRVTYDLLDEIVLAEAKFLMIDFWVDNFGTQSEEFTEEIQACESISHLRACLNNIVAVTEKQCPGQLPALGNLVKEINKTA